MVYRQELAKIIYVYFPMRISAFMYSSMSICADSVVVPKNVFVRASSLCRNLDSYEYIFLLSGSLE